jgi:hypothetical protein
MTKVGNVFSRFLVAAVIAAVIGVVVQNATAICKSAVAGLHPMACIAEQYEAPVLPDLHQTSAELPTLFVLLAAVIAATLPLPRPRRTLDPTIRWRLSIPIRSGTKPFTKDLFLPFICPTRDS